MLVVGDIGGTKTLLALFERGTDLRKPVAQKEYHSASFPGLAPIVQQFLSETGKSAEVGCFDVAGPVEEGAVHTTNLPWTMSEAELAKDIGLRRVTLMNDLQAIAAGVPHLLPAELETLNEGQAEPDGSIAVIAPGTGLGEAFLVRSGEGYIACASEGGHASFSPTSERQIDLLRFLRRKFGEVSAERVASGMSVGDLYDFLRDSGAASEAPGFAAQLQGAADRTPPIAEAGVDDRAGNPLAAATMDLFVELLASEAGNLALKVLSTGGIYLAGGMPVHVLPLLRSGGFVETFAAKGRLAPVLKQMPVHVVMINAALLGATVHGMALLGAG